MTSKQEFNLCRLCLCTGLRLMDVFSGSCVRDFSVEETIQDLLTFKAVQNLDFPWLVCSTCMTKLTEFRLFKRQCLECKMAFESRFLGIESRVKEEEVCNTKGSDNKSPTDELEQMDEEEVMRHKSHVCEGIRCPVPQDISPHCAVLLEEETTEDNECLTSEIAYETEDEPRPELPRMENVEPLLPLPCDVIIKMEEAELTKEKPTMEEEEDITFEDGNAPCENECLGIMDNNALNKISKMKSADVNDEGQVTEEEEQSDVTCDDEFVPNEDEDSDIMEDNAPCQVMSIDSKMKEFIVVELTEKNRMVITIAPKNWLYQEEGEKILLWPPKVSGSETALVKAGIEPDSATWLKYCVLTISRPFQEYHDAHQLKDVAIRRRSLMKAKEELEKCRDTGHGLALPTNLNLAGESASEESGVEEDVVENRMADACWRKQVEKILPLTPAMTVFNKNKKRLLEKDNERDSKKRTENEISRTEEGFVPSNSAGISSHDYCKATLEMDKEISKALSAFKEKIIEEIRNEFLPIKLNVIECLENQVVMKNILKEQGIKSSPSNEAIDINSTRPLKLPACDPEEIITVEGEIGMKKESFRYLVDYFLDIKMKDKGKWVRKNLERTVSNSLARLYNWTGKQKKKSFSESFPKVIEAFHVAAKTSFREGYDQMVVNSEIRKWLRNARARKTKSNDKEQVWDYIEIVNVDNLQFVDNLEA